MYKDLHTVAKTYQRRASSAASSALFGGGVGEEPGDWGSLWTPGLTEGAQGPVGVLGAHA